MPPAGKRRESLAALADRVVPFPLAARWAGISAGGQAKTYCPFPFEHSDGGSEKAFRAYPDHGFCFAEERYFTVTGLLAAVREVSREDAAVWALREYGYRPAAYAHLWADAIRPPEPDREALRAALATWCAAVCPDWERRQFDERVARRLGRCFGLLPRVHSRDDCDRWLAAAKQAMAPYLS